MAHDAADNAQQALSRVGVELEPRGQWPSGMDKLGVPVKGKLKADEISAPGRALARMTDLGWGNQLRALLAETAPDAPLEQGVIDACIKVLAQWNWEARPVAVVAMPSRRRPQLITSLAQALAGLGRIPYLGTLTTPEGWPEGQPGGNSAFRLASVWNRFQVPAEGPAWFAANPGPVLLVDDLADSRWTITVAGRALRQAGAESVLPFALALRA